jgi:hypothetical protein
MQTLIIQTERISFLSLKFDDLSNGFPSSSGKGKTDEQNER